MLMSTCGFGHLAEQRKHSKSSLSYILWVRPPGRTTQAQQRQALSNNLQLTPIDFRGEGAKGESGFRNAQLREYEHKNLCADFGRERMFGFARG
jgi:hypothetical protein